MFIFRNKFWRELNLQPILTPNPQPNINQWNCLQGEVYLFASDWPLS